MSQENVEVVRRLYPGSVDLVAAIADPEAFKATRLALEPLVHRDLETVTVSGQIPLTGAGEIPVGSSAPTAHGLNGFASAWRDWLSAWEAWVVAPDEFIEVDENRVLVLIEVRARSKTHHVEMPIQGANLLTLRDGKVARLELFFNRTKAFEAVGLSD
jgi:hypothetical protein